MSKTPSYRVIIAAQNASTVFGGEAILPVHYFRILRDRGADVHLVTHARNRGNLTAYFDGDLRGITFSPDTAFQKAISRYARPSSETLRGHLASNAMTLNVEVWQRRLVRSLVEAVDVALVHVPTPVSPRGVSLMRGVGAPVVFGPMNGGMNYPPGYSSHRSRSQQFAIIVGRAASRVAHFLLPAKRHAARLLVANARTRAALPVRTDGRSVATVVENGVRMETWKAVDRTQRDTGPFRLVFVGRLIGWKAVDVTLQAIAATRQSGLDVRLDIVGAGKQEPGLRALARELGLGDAVSFLGFLPQSAIADLFARSDALILNSLNECGGAVVLEAMAAGLPVIASDWGGPADYVDATSGVLVPPSPRTSFPDRLADAISSLASDPATARRMGDAGRARVLAEFDWDRKVDRVLDIFDEVIAERRSEAPAIRLTVP